MRAGMILPLLVLPLHSAVLAAEEIATLDPEEIDRVADLLG